MALGFYGWRNNYIVPTPELGISETISNLLGNKSTTSQGGSNLIGSNYAQQALPQTLGATNTGGATGTWGYQPTNTTNQNTYTSPTNPTAQPTQSSGGQSNPIIDQINSGYNSYFSQLDQALASLPDQKSNLESTVQNSYNTNLTDLNNQKSMGLADLATEENKITTNQTKNLTSLADSIRNQFMMGQNLLGARGAGDSSANSMYSYALTKMGNKSRGDIMNTTAGLLGEVGNRRFKVNTIYDTEINRLNNDKSNKLLEISNWYSQAQQSLRDQIATGQLKRSQDIASASTNILNQALSVLSAFSNEYNQNKTLLTSWATNQLSSVANSNQQIQQNASYNPSLPLFNGLNGTPNTGNGSGSNLYGFGNYTQDKDQPWYYRS